MLGIGGKKLDGIVAICDFFATFAALAGVDGTADPNPASPTAVDGNSLPVCSTTTSVELCRLNSVCLLTCLSEARAQFVAQALICGHILRVWRKIHRAPNMSTTI